jgi:hypothetical protein
MNNEAVRSRATLAAVHNFATAEAALFPPATIAGQMFTEISSGMALLDANVAAQVAGDNTAREGTEQKALAQEELLDLLMMFRRTARSMDDQIPGVHAKFRVPPKLSAAELLGVAETFATEALPLKTEFIAYGMPATFLEDLNEQIAELREALTIQTAGTRTRVTSTASIDEILTKAFTALRRVDPIVRNILRDQPAKLAAWESARHLERAPRRKKTSGGGTGGTPPVS